MRTVTIELPDNVARVFETMSSKRKASTALLAACIANDHSVALSTIFARIDKKVDKSGVSEEELDDLLDELS